MLFDAPGVVKVGCNIHDWMMGVILVVPTPLLRHHRRRRRLRAARRARRRRDAGGVARGERDRRSTTPPSDVTVDDGAAPELTFTLAVRPERARAPATHGARGDPMTLVGGEPAPHQDLRRLLRPRSSALLLATLWLVELAVSRQAERSLTSELMVTGEVFRQLLAEREERLTSNSVLLTGDFALKRALATYDPATLATVAVNYRERSGVDLLWILDEAGHVLADAAGREPAGSNAGDRPPIAAARATRQAGGGDRRGRRRARAAGRGAGARAGRDRLARARHQHRRRHGARSRSPHRLVGHLPDRATGSSPRRGMRRRAAASSCRRRAAASRSSASSRAAAICRCWCRSPRACPRRCTRWCSARGTRRWRRCARSAGAWR